MPQPVLDDDLIFRALKRSLLFASADRSVIGIVTNPAGS
jgi:hypothetical protein